MSQSLENVGWRRTSKTYEIDLTYEKKETCTKHQITFVETDDLMMKSLYYFLLHLVVYAVAVAAELGGSADPPMLVRGGVKTISLTGNRKTPSYLKRTKCSILTKNCLKFSVAITGTPPAPLSVQAHAFWPPIFVMWYHEIQVQHIITLQEQHHLLQ